MSISDWNPNATPNVTIPKPYLIAIGKVSYVWGVLESIVDMSIAKLGGGDIFDPRCAILTLHMTWPLKMDVLEALVTELREENPWLAKFDRAKPLLKKAQEGRNKIIHGQWNYENGQVYKLRATARGRLKTNIVPVEVENIEAIALDIHKAGIALLETILNK